MGRHVFPCSIVRFASLVSQCIVNHCHFEGMLADVSIVAVNRRDTNQSDMTV